MDYGHYWTATTLLTGARPGSEAVYFAFGRGMGYMHEEPMDVHGAGCQRSDPKSGSREDYPLFDLAGPQGDEQRVFNLVRAVRCNKPSP